MALVLVLGPLAACAGSRVDSAGRILESAWSWNEERPVADQPSPEDPSGSAPERAGGAREASPSVWTLDLVLEQVARANPTIAAAQASLEQAEAARREALAAWFPELSLGLDYLSTDNPAQAFAVLLNQQALTLGPGFDPTPGSTENWRKEVRLDWSLLAPGRGDSISAATAGEEAARLAGEALERRLLNAGVQAWLGLRAARALEEVARESIAVVEQRLEQTRLRHQQGAALRADVLRLEVRLASAKQESARAALAVREAESSLDHLMGRHTGAPLAVGDEELEIGAALPHQLDGLLALAEAERRDVSASAQRVRMAGFQREASRAERLPSLQAFASYDVDGSEPAIDGDLASYTLGLGLRFPFSAGTEARVRSTAAQERLAREELRELVLDAAREVRDAFEALRVAEETLALAEASVGAAEEAYRIVAEGQDAGGATVTDVLEAEDARKTARVRQVAARAGLQIARARLVGATGGVR